MNQVPLRFSHNDIISLTSAPVRYDLAESVGPDLKLGSLLNDSMRAALDDLALAYGSTRGNEVLRRLIGERHGVNGDDVITTVGSMQALFLIAFILSEPGDEVVIARPVFPNARTVLDAVRANIVELPISFDDGYRINIERLRSKLTARTRLLVLASPQNPSGVALTDSDVRSILSSMDEICPDAFLLIDETYREATYGDAEVRPSFVGLDRRIVSCASLSKCHGAPGIRTGWAITTHEGLRDQIMLGKFNTIIANSLVDDALAVQIMRDSERVFADRRHHLQSGLQRISAFVERHAELVEWVRPDAGALCCLRLKQGIFDQAAIGRFYDALAACDTRVGHGPWFGEDASVFRLGFGLLSMPNLDEALSRVSQSMVLAGQRQS